jgi:phosphopantetheinyl transferase
MGALATVHAMRIVAQVSQIASDVHGAQVWTARTGRVTQAQREELALLLDEDERARALQFRFDADRCAFVLAHAIRRAAIALALDSDPAHVRFSAGANGQPVLQSPQPPRPLFFSHSRSRRAVACAVGHCPLGIDVEPIAEAAADFGLLTPFVVLPDPYSRAMELGADRVRQFFFYWTALEAFWKAAGSGLVPSNPRIHCRRNMRGLFDIALEADPDSPLAHAVEITSQPGCAITLVLHFAAARATDEAGSLAHGDITLSATDFFA